MSYRIGIIGGDGIGPEVIAEAVKVVDATGVAYEPMPFDLGGERYLRDGVVLDDADLDEHPRARRGAARRGRHPRACRPACIERGILLPLRFELDLYVNLRPFLAGPTRFNDGVDMLVIRENTEGIYAGEGGFLRKGTPHEVATQGSVNTRIGVERCVRFAFDLAQSRPRASTSRSCTRPTCSRSPATSGSARSTRSRPSTPTSTPPTTTSTPRASTSCRIPAATT